MLERPPKGGLFFKYSGKSQEPAVESAGLNTIHHILENKIQMRKYPLSIFFILLVSTAVIAGDDVTTTAPDIVQTCVACHGEKGNSKIELNPILAGQHFYYLYTQLRDFKEGRRDNAIMTPLASSLEKEVMQTIAQYYSEQTWPGTDYQATREQIALGKQVVNSGQCVACHLGGFEGNSRVPRLAGQHYEYLVKTMMDFKNKTRTNAAAKASLFATYSEEEIKAVAAYLSGFKEE